MQEVMKDIVQAPPNRTVATEDLAMEAGLFGFHGNIGSGIAGKLSDYTPASGGRVLRRKMTRFHPGAGFYAFGGARDGKP